MTTLSRAMTDSLQRLRAMTTRSDALSQSFRASARRRPLSNAALGARGAIIRVLRGLRSGRFEGRTIYGHGAIPAPRILPSPFQTRSDGGGKSLRGRLSED